MNQGESGEGTGESGEGLREGGEVGSMGIARKSFWHAVSLLVGCSLVGWLVGCLSWQEM